MAILFISFGLANLLCPFHWLHSPHKLNGTTYLKPERGTSGPDPLLISAPRFVYRTKGTSDSLPIRWFHFIDGGSDGCLFCSGGPGRVTVSCKWSRWAVARRPAHAVSCGRRRRRRRHHRGALALSYSAVALRRICRALCFSDVAGVAGQQIAGSTSTTRSHREKCALPDAACRHGAACVLRAGARLFLDGRRFFLAREPRAGAGADKKNCPRPSNLRLTNRLDAWLFVTILFTTRFTLKAAKSDWTVQSVDRKMVRFVQ